MLAELRPARDRRLLLALLAAALILRVAALIIRGDLGVDRSSFHEYVISGSRLIADGQFASPFLPRDLPPQPSGILPPLYSLVVAAAFLLFGDATPLAIGALQLLNALATTVLVAFVYSAGRMLGGPRCAWIAAVLAVFNPLLIIYPSTIWDTSLFCLGVTIAVWVSVRLVTRGGSLKSYLALGLGLGFLALLNPAFTLAYPLLVLWPLRRNRLPALRTTTACLAAVAGWAFILTPWTIRNYQQFGSLAYVRTGLWHEIWMGACPDAESNPRAVYRTTFLMGNPQIQRHAAAIGESAYVAECGRSAREAIAADPARYAKLAGHRFIDFWFGTVRSHAERPLYAWLPRGTMRLCLAGFLSIETAILLVGVLRRPRALDYLWLLGIAGGFCLVYIFAQVMLRYRAPLEPVLALLVALSIAPRDVSSRAQAA